MTKRKDQIRLGAFLMATGHHAAAWRHSRAQADAGVNLAHYIALAQAAERAKFDAVFLADSQGGFLNRDDPGGIATVSQGATFEPITLLSAIAAHTSHIGLIATATTTYYEPFILARLFASLDILSGGRAGWNLVTSASSQEAANFSRAEHPEPEARYARAEEFADVVKGLWQSWEEDAFPRDKASGRFSDPDKLHILNHVGEHFSVAGPLNVPRSAQGHPVIVQAGSSGPGKALAARTAEVVFTAHQTLESAQGFYADLKGRMAAFGRSPAQLKVMPGVFPVVGGTEAEALAKYEELQALVHPDIPRRFLAQIFGRPELLDHPIDEPLPDWLEADANRASRPALLLDLARSENLTARQLHLRVAGARGHHTIYGTPETIADQLEAWFDGHGADGFNIMPPHLPDGLDDFVEQVLPELRRRGRFRTDYEGPTLRENLGLGYPVHPGRVEQAVAAE
jgi:FMN-dependent oxidoreductase (nitrilotriacetate monooxygenase family)